MIQLIEAKTLKVRDCFPAEKFALNLNERSSTATITVGPTAPNIGIGDWLKDENEPGAGIVWRVKSVATDYATDTRTISCEHMITRLKDLILFGEVTPATIAGKKKATTCTARQAVEYILTKTADWKLGTFGFDKTAPYNFNGDSLFDALETVSSSLLKAWWSYDFSSYPFKLSIQPKATAVSCEMRMDRNITSLKRTVDRSRMYTRFYPIGKNDLHLSGAGYVSKNEDLYGIIHKTETDQSKSTQQELEDWANEKLENHAEPTVTVNVSGLDLSAATGESLDKLTLGKICRIPLPEYGTTITEPITSLSWSDKIADPESVAVTLANQVEDVASIINNLNKSSGSGGRAAAKNAKEDHAWIVDTEDHVALIAEAVAGEGADKDWSRVSKWNVGADGILGTVTRMDGTLSGYETRFQQNETSISMVVGIKKGKKYIKAGEIALSINESTGKSEAKINADHVYIGNKKSTTVINGKCKLSDVTADYISGKIASLANVNVKFLTSERGGIKVASVSTSSYYQGDVQCYVPHAITNLRISTSGKTCTLQRQRFSDSNWVNVGSWTIP